MVHGYICCVACIPEVLQHTHAHCSSTLKKRDRQQALTLVHDLALLSPSP